MMEFKRRLVDDKLYVQPDQDDQDDQDEDIDRLLQRSKRLGMSLPVRRRPSIHPNAEDYEESSDEEEKEKEYIRRSNKDALLEEAKSPSSWISILCMPIFLVLAMGAAGLIICFKIRDMPSMDPDLADQYHEDIAPYKIQFPSQSNELWGNVLAGIQLTSSSNRLSVFLITHDSSTNTSCLAQALGRVSANLLSKSAQPLIVPASDLNHSESFRQDLSTRRAIVVEELQEMPVGQNQRMLLHGLADIENPIVPGIAVVLTLRVHEQATSMNALRAAELELERVWDSIDSESRSPLIVRVTSGFVYKMASEKEVINC